MINGLYDAKMDNVPMLALVAQSESTNQNRHSFQETEVLPLYENVGVFNRKVTSGAQLVYVINDAIRYAYERKGPSIVILHNDYMGEIIDYEPTVDEKFIPGELHPEIDHSKIDKTVELLKSSKCPVMYVGLGVRKYRDLAVKVSEKFNIPVVSSAISGGISFPKNHKNYMGSCGRLGTKPGTEITDEMDHYCSLVLTIHLQDILEKMRKLYM